MNLKSRNTGKQATSTLGPSSVTVIWCSEEGTALERFHSHKTSEPKPAQHALDESMLEFLDLHRAIGQALTITGLTSNSAGEYTENVHVFCVVIMLQQGV